MKCVRRGSHTSSLGGVLFALTAFASTLAVPFSTEVAIADPATGPGAFSTTATGPITSGPVPDGTCAAKVSALGGAGASAAAIGASGGQGAAAASIAATFNVLPLQTYSGSVGGGGAIARVGGVGGGGTGTDAPTDHDGAGGGGRTAVAIAGTNIVVAGGGGGAGAAHQSAPLGNGGAAGFSLTAAGVAIGTNGSIGQDSTGVPGGGQGGQAAGGGLGGVHTTTPARSGTAGDGTATGAGGNGGTDLNYDGGGGGGAGYTGGGGGSATVNQSVSGAGGGGGSSFVAAASPTVAATAPTSVSGAAGATPALGAAGTNGSMSIDWIPCLYNLTLTKTPSVSTVNAGGTIRWTISVTNIGPDPMTRGDVLTLTDTLPSGSNATSPSPNNVVRSIATSGGSNANMTSGAVTCTGLVVGAAMPATTDCSRAYAGATGTPGSPSGGARGLDVDETLTVTYDQFISNTAPCGTITDTATVRDRPTANISVATDTTGNIVTDTAAGTVTINCYDLGVTKTASAPTVVQGGTITWTVTVVNNGPGNMFGPGATTANPLVVTDTFPTTGVGVATLTSSVGPAGACTFTSPTVTCPGSLNSGQQQVLTFTQPVNLAATVGSTISNTATISDPRTGDTNDSSTASTQVVAAPRIVLQKSLGGVNRFNNADEFVMTVTGPGGSSATTAGAGSTITGGTVTVAAGTAGTDYTLSEAMAAGSVGTLGQYANSISCTNAFAGSSTVLPAGTGTSFVVRPQASDNITCTFTNTQRPATVTVAKTTLGGTDSFGFTMTNLASTSTTVATSTAGTPAASAQFSVTALNTAVSITETVPTGWRLTGATCADANSAATGNTGTFGTFAGNAITVAAAFVEPAASITCTFTNEKLARLVIQKTANGGAGTFGYTTTGGLSPSTFSLSPNPPTTPSVSQTFTNLFPGTYTVTEGASPSFQLTDLTCVAAGTSAAGSTITTNVATRQLSVTLVAGADYTCTYTNVRDAQITIVKTSIGGDNTFGFTTAGTGNAVEPTPSITTTSGVGSSSFAVPFATGVTTRTVTITESTLPAGWVPTGITCTNAAGTTIGTVALPAVTLSVVPGDVLSCNVTNQRLPRVTIRKQTIGPAGSFSFTGGTNGLPASLTLDTTAANPASSAAYQLAALNTATSITETALANYTLTSATCVNGSGTAVSTSLSGSTLTIAPSAVVGGGDLTCTFVNSRRSAQVRVDKRWLGAIVNSQVTISSTGGSSNPGLVSIANTANEVDAGTAVTVYAGQTLTFSEVFNVGSASAYTTSLACTGATDTNPNDGLTIAAADDGATVVCTYTNSRIPNVVKTAGGVTGPTAAGIYTATYAVTVDNAGSATTYGALTDTPAFASNLQVTGASWTAAASAGAAPAAGSATGAGPFTLAPSVQAISTGATHTFNVAVTFRFTTYTAAPACAGSGTGLFNSVATATPELQITDNAACIAPPAPPTPSIDIVKTASPTTVSAAVQTITYSFVVTNTGNVDLSSVVVSDPKPGLSVITCPTTSLAPGATMTCTATYSTTQADIDAGAIVNTASVSGSAPNGSTVTDSDPETVTATRTPSIALVKTASPTTVTAANQTVTYTFAVTNTGNVTLTSVGVTDPKPGLSTITCGSTTLAPTASTSCTATYSVTQADMNAGRIDNTATASGTPPAGAGGPVTASDSETVTATPAPAIDLQKSASPTTIIVATQVVTYSFLVTNIGNVSLTGIVVVDPLPGLGTITCPTTTLAPLATTTCTAPYIVTQSDLDGGVINNTAVVQGTPPTGPIVTDADSETVTATRVPVIDLVKTASPTTISAPNQTVTYSFAVTNTGNVTLNSVAVSDPLPGLGSITCPLTTLAPGASTTCSATYLSTQADVDRGRIDNTANVSASPAGGGAAVTDTDSETVTATRTPAIDVVKAANPTTVTAANQIVTYSFVVTNTGNVTLSNVGVTDPLPGLSAISCPASTLAPGAATTCTATYAVTQANINAGRIDNTATATGTPPAGAGGPVTDTDSETVAATRTPSIDLAKSATPNNVTAANQVVTYSFVVTNTGNVTLTSVVVTDPLPGLSTVTCPSTTLAPAATMSCSASYSVTQADVNAGAINNVATVSGTPPAGAGGAVTDTDAATVTATLASAIQIVKTASPTTVSAVGQVVSYAFVVTNTGNVTLSTIAVTDPLPGLSTVTCPTTTLAPAASMSCTASRSVIQADLDAGSIDNTATVTGRPPSGPVVTDTDSATVAATRSPSIDLVKSAAPTTVVAANQVVSYSFLVTNTGNVTLTGIGVTDPLPGMSAVTCPAVVLAPAATTTCTATRAVTQAEVDLGSVTNTATVSGTPPSGPAVTDTSSSTVTATGAPSIDLVKSAAPTTVTAANQAVTYSFLVTNTGNVTLGSITVTDPLAGLGAISCPVSSLAPAAATTCTATRSTSQADVNAGSITNTATVTANPPTGAAVTDTSSALVTATRTPSIDLVKSASPNNVTAAGQLVTYSFVVTNTGNVTLTGVVVTDPLPALSAISCPATVLAPAASTTCTATYTSTVADIDNGRIDNTATVRGTPPAGPAVTDTAIETVTAAAAPAIQIVKSALPTTVTAANTTISYSFLVTNTGNVTLTGIGVTDALPGLGTITCPAATLVPTASMSCSATYTTTQADVNAGRIDNTATVTGVPPTGPAVTDASAATVIATRAASIDLVKAATPTTVTIANQVVSYSFVVTNTGNVTLTGVAVTDPLPGMSAVSCPATTLAPAAAMTCSATRAVTQSEIDAGFVLNTATAAGDPPVGAGPRVSDSDSETVTAPSSPAIALTKSALPTTVAAANQTIIYSFAVTNTGNVTLTGVGVNDPLPGLGAISCLATTLAPAAATTCSAAYTTTQTDVDAGRIDNVATASGEPPSGAPVSATATATVLAPAVPSISLDKSATPNNVTTTGQIVSYSFLVTNTGNVTLGNVGVGDPLVGLSAITCPLTTLAPAASTTCTASYAVTLADLNLGRIDNTATASGTPPAGPAVTASDSATVTATNAPAIQLVKSANPTTVTAANQTVLYSFVVTNTGNVTLTGVGVSDPLPGLPAVNCPVTTLAPNAITTCTASYTATQADVDAGRIDNTATATGSPPTGPAVSDSASAAVLAPSSAAVTIDKTASPVTVTAANQIVTYSFAVTNVGNVTLSNIVVADPLNGLSTITCPVTTLAPAATTTCAATYSVTQADVDSSIILNSATVTATPPVGPNVSDSDGATVTAPPSAEIEVVKTANPSTVTAANQTIAYSFRVTNTGNVTLTSIAVADPLPTLSAVACPATTLAPAGTFVCTATYVTTQADIDAGRIDNTATATGTPPTGPTVSDTDSALVLAPPSPSITIVKSASPNNVTVASQTVSYSFVVTNTGNVTLDPVTVTDPLTGLSAVSCPATALAPAATMTCTASYSVTPADIDAGRIDNTATATGTPPTGPAVSSSESETVTALRAPAIQVVKSALPVTVTAANQAVAYSFAVTNTGNVTLTSVAVTDALPGLSPITCPTATLAAGASTTCTASYTTTQADIDRGSIVNTASVSGLPPIGPAVTDIDSATVTAPATPSIDVAKSATPPTVTAANQAVAYSFVVTNTGNVTLTGVGVFDPLPGLSGVTCPVTTLVPSATTTCTASYTTTQADVDRGSIVNTATASGTPPTGPAVTDTATFTVTAPAAASIALSKTATPTSVTASGQVVSYAFVVTNTGNVTLTGVGVTDVLPGLSIVSCPTTVLAPAGSMTCTATRGATQADIDLGRIDNTATASGTPPAGPAVTAVDSETVAAPPNPSISLVKSASPNNVIAANQVVTYSFVVTNTGNVTLTSVGVADPLPGLATPSCPVIVLAPGAATTCTATYTVTPSDMNAGRIDNTATASGTPPVGAAVTATDTETVTATAAPAIQVAKSASPTIITAALTPITYTFVVTNTGNVTLTGVAVADPLPGLGPITCPVTTLGPAATTTCTATLTASQANVDAGSITNTATVIGTPPTGAAVTDTDTAVVIATRTPSIGLVKSSSPATVATAGTVITYSFAVTNTGNVTLTGVAVADPLSGLGPVTCPTTTLAPAATTTCTATKTATQVDVDAGSILNTATVTGTPPAGPVVTATSSHVVTAPPAPSITVAKTAAPTSVTAAGQSVTFSFVVTNTGNVTLTGVGVADPLPGLGPVTCSTTTLAPGVSAICAASYTTTLADMNAGSIVNTATARGVPPSGPAVTDTDSATVVAAQAPAIDVVKDAAPIATIVPGSVVAYTFAVTNTGNVTLTAIAVTDPLPGLSAVTCPVTALVPGASTTCTATYAISLADIASGAIANTATASGLPPTGPRVTDVDTVTIITAQSSGISIDKTASPTTAGGAGETVAYTFVVTNIGTVALTAVSVSDPLPGLSAVTCPATTLAAGASFTCSATYAVTQADADAGSVVNTATASGLPPFGAAVTATDSATVAIAPAPAISLVKTMNPTSVGAVGTVITYTFVITNTGNITLTGVTLTDALPGLSAVSCGGFGGVLAPGAATTCTATYAVRQTDLDLGMIRNNASVVANAGVGGVQVTAAAAVAAAAAQNPAMTLTKSVSAITVSTGTTVTYTLVGTNTGNVTLTNVIVADPLLGLTPLQCGGFDGTLVPGATLTCTTTYRATYAASDNGRITNGATIAGRTPSGLVVGAAATATLTVVRLALPTTGADVVGSFWIALVWSLLGLLLVVISHRRRPRLS